MDLGDFFRSFLGLGDRERRDFPNTDDDCDCRSEADSSDSSQPEFHFFFGNKGNSLDDMFHHFHGDMHRQMESLHRQMEDMMKGFGTIASEHFPPAHRPGITDKSESHPSKSDSARPFFIQPDYFDPRKDKRNPRDFMLKDNEEVKTQKGVSPSPESPSQEDPRSFAPFRRFFPWNQPRQDHIKDTDLDGKVSSADAVEMIKKSNEEKVHQNTPRQGFFSGSSVTMTTVRGPDGKVEQKRVVRDSSGREEVEVSRSVDGQSHTVTTITGPNGVEERREDFKNIDQNDIQKFQDKWNSHQDHPRPSNPPMLGPPRPPIFGPSTRLNPRDMELFSNIFGKPPK